MKFEGNTSPLMWGAVQEGWPPEGGCYRGWLGRYVIIWDSGHLKVLDCMPEFPLIENTTFDPEDEYRPEPEPEPQEPAWMDGSLRIGIHTSIAGNNYLNARWNRRAEAGVQRATDFFGKPADVARRFGAHTGVGSEGISRAAAGVGTGAAGHPRKLPGEPGGAAADVADAVDPGVL